MICKKISSSIKESINIDDVNRKLNSMELNNGFEKEVNPIEYANEFLDNMDKGL